MVPLLISLLLAPVQATPHPGHLIVAGGGPLPVEAAQRALALAGGKEARVVIFPQASGLSNAGARSRAFWEKSGARHVTVIEAGDPPKAALAAIGKADLIWLPGGGQNRLMAFLNKNGLVEPIRDRYRQGATVGGTSAGAAVLSPIMLTGRVSREGSGASRTVTDKGLGLWQGVIVDTHFYRRQRFDRLKGAVIDHATEVGVGIDEATAVVVDGDGKHFEVLGKSKVKVIDARKAGAGLKAYRDGKTPPAGVALLDLEPGRTFDLQSGTRAK